jgi:hypothetical protein
MRTVRASRAIYDTISTSSLAPYICKSCRQNALRQSIPNAQQLRHASSSDIPFTEKIRRRIWGTDNPPGLKDPYGGPGFFERRRMARKKTQAGDEMQEAEQEQEYEEMQTRDDREDLEAEFPAAQDGYKPAETWDGLEHVGHLGHWRDIPPRPIDQYHPYGS